MSEPTGTPSGTRYLIGGGAAACAACCAPPVLALIGIAGVGTAATVATLAFAGLVFALVVAVVSGVAFIVRKRQRDRSLALRGSRARDRALPPERAGHG
ncbi:hypothetical protein [Nocardioides conyzicola]|uniref:Mercuric ion transport protein n=1 Tax=Nocardioides conyzicola TaxID=1651781 RepID=A0ABP8WP76_9ACTN